MFNSATEEAWQDPNHFSVQKHYGKNFKKAVL